MIVTPVTKPIDSDTPTVAFEQKVFSMKLLPQRTLASHFLLLMKTTASVLLLSIVFQERVSTISRDSVGCHSILTAPLGSISC